LNVVIEEGIIIYTWIYLLLAFNIQRQKYLLYW
jgi:hypothetical protein